MRLFILVFKCHACSGASREGIQILARQRPGDTLYFRDMVAHAVSTMNGLCTMNGLPGIESGTSEEGSSLL